MYDKADDDDERKEKKKKLNFDFSSSFIISFCTGLFPIQTNLVNRNGIEIGLFIYRERDRASQHQTLSVYRRSVYSGAVIMSSQN